MIGVLGNVVFTVSDEKVLTFNDMNKKSSVRTAKHEIIGRKPVTEFLGEDLESISFNMRLDAQLNVSPLQEISNLEYLRSTGSVCTLILGDWVVGDYIIKSLSESFDYFYRDGALLKATVSVELEEYN